MPDIMMLTAAESDIIRRMNTPHHGLRPRTLSRPPHDPHIRRRPPAPDITATALVHGAPLATRNTADFTLCGIALINPFDVG